jgi:hypothetical protein
VRRKADSFCQTDTLKRSITALAYVLVLGTPDRFRCGKQVGSLLDCFRQLIDARIESIQQFQQFPPAAVGPARQAQSFQLGSPLFCP